MKEITRLPHPLLLEKQVTSNDSTEASGSKPRSNTKKNRILPAKKENKKEVEVPLRTNKSVWTKVNRVDSSISSKRVVINSNSESVCKTGNKCVNSASHGMCVVNILNSVNATSTVKTVLNKGKQIWKPKGRLSDNSLYKTKRVWKATGKLFTDIGYQWRPTGTKLTLGKLDCGSQWRPTGKKFALGEMCHLTKLSVKCCSKHMTGNRSKLMNFVEKFIGSVRFGNDHLGAIMGYGDYVMGDSVISRVYYVEGLGHNLFSVGQFCDSDLEVAFRKHTCFVRDIKGTYILKGSRGTNLYTISIDEMMKSSPICLLSKASKCGIFHQKSVPRTPQQNGVVERRNRTLVEAARTMMIFSKAPMFLWAEAVATACYTQNRSLIHTRHNKTPYELVHDKKPDLTFFRVFGALCYPTNDSEDLGKFQAKADIGIFVGYAPSRKGYRIYNKRTRRLMETIHVTFDEMHQSMAPVRMSSGPEPFIMTPGQLKTGLAPTDKELEMLFQPMFDEHIEQSRVNEPVPSATEINAQVVPPGTSLSTTIAQDAPSTSASSSTSDIHHPVQHQEIAEEPTHEDTPNPIRSVTQPVNYPLRPSQMMDNDHPLDKQSLVIPLRRFHRTNRRSLCQVNLKDWKIRKNPITFYSSEESSLWAKAGTKGVMAESCQDVKIQKEVRREVLSFLEIDWLVGHQRSKEARQYQLQRLNTSPCLDVVLKSFGCDHSLKTTDLTSIKFLCTVTTKVLLLFVVTTSSTLGLNTSTYRHHFIGAVEIEWLNFLRGYSNYQLAHLSPPKASHKRTRVAYAELPNSGLPNSGLPNSGLPNSGLPNSGLPNSGLPTAVGLTTGLPNSGLPNSGLPNSWLPNSGLTNSELPYGGLSNSWLSKQRNTMAEQNIPTQPPTRTDEQIVPRSQWLTIGKSNLLFNAQKIQKNPIFQISVDILKEGVYSCQVDEQWFDLSVDLLRKALAITPVIPAHPFELPPSGNTVIDFVNELGYPEPVEIVSNIRVNYVYQPWRAILTLINQCLTGKTMAVTNPDTRSLQMLLRGIVHFKSNVDHAELLWEEFTQGIQTFFSHKASHKASLKNPKKKVNPLLIP
ncbi:integrase, catalytic region, zinc finger, CCHC-type containing protein [Tanacetum coccineum]|uniref:Integrase, catalytic region, zinc finger, CCHC-type containing protein n=1 Tax=Tanacetum coccineum TaxID=301880 RepID=A0ABQ5GAL5_9ASTR